MVGAPLGDLEPWYHFSVLVSSVVTILIVQMVLPSSILLLTRVLMLRAFLKLFWGHVGENSYTVSPQVFSVFLKKWNILIHWENKYDTPPTSVFIPTFEPFFPRVPCHTKEIFLSFCLASSCVQSGREAVSLSLQYITLAWWNLLSSVDDEEVFPIHSASDQWMHEYLILRSQHSGAGLTQPPLPLAGRYEIRREYRYVN